MSILSGFKSFERYIKIPTGSNTYNYQLASERTLLDDIVVNKTYTMEEYNNLPNKDPSKFYVIVE